MINASLIPIHHSCKTVNQNLFGQFGTINIPVALSIFFFFFFFFFVIPSLCMKMGGNSKRINYAMKHKTHLSFLLSGLVDKQKIEGVGHLL